jgi:electron-transferring-flavoprotein dehydrogenase
VRNIRPGFNRGLWFGLANAAFETYVTRGHSLWTLANHADDKALKHLDYPSPERDWGERELPPRDRLAFVFFASTMHDENQPVHLRVADTTLCATRCVTEFGNPCTNFCPASVYEMIADGGGGTKLQINASNCVHCKACDIKEPYTDQITWVTPEGGSGPNYQSL